MFYYKIKYTLQISCYIISSLLIGYLIQRYYYECAEQNKSRAEREARLERMVEELHSRNQQDKSEDKKKK